MTHYQEIVCPDCGTKSFMLDTCRAYEPGIKAQLIDKAINGSGIRDTARVLKIDKNTVLSTLKKRRLASCKLTPD